MSSTTLQTFDLEALNSRSLGPRSAKVPHIADFKSAYISVIIGSWAGNLLMLSDLASVSCLSSGYKFASVFRCVGLVITGFH